MHMKKAWRLQALELAVSALQQTPPTNLLKHRLVSRLHIYSRHGPRHLDPVAHSKLRSWINELIFKAGRFNRFSRVALAGTRSGCVRTSILLASLIHKFAVSPQALELAVSALQQSPPTNSLRHRLIYLDFAFMSNAIDIARIWSNTLISRMS